MPEFEILLISIDWDSPDRVRTIVPSKKFLEASKSNGNKYEYDFVLYNKEDDLYFQFAVKTIHTPFLKTNDGNWNQNSRLYNIQDDLWIIKGDWRTGQRGISYHHCPSINTIGKIEIGISENLQQIQQFVTIDINSNIDDFDFDQLKNDFEGELWSLITSKRSLVTVDKIDFRYGDKIIRFPENKLIFDFLSEFDKIAKNPKRELSNTKQFRRIEKVIPIAETYRKLSTSGTSTLLPSKAVLENHDIYENRLVCFMLHRIHWIVTNNIKSTSLQIEKLQNKIKSHTQKITILQDPDPKVNPEEVEQQISFQEQRVHNLQNRWDIISNTLAYKADLTYTSIRIKIKFSHNIEPNTFWCSTNTSVFCLFSFPTIIMEYLEEGTEFQFEANFNQSGTVQTKAGKAYPTFIMNNVRKIVSVELISEQNILIRQRSNKTILENRGWSQISILNVQQKIKYQEERNNQVHTLRKQIEQINFQIKNICDYYEEQSELQPLIGQRLKTSFFKRIKWKNSQGFKPSMTFIQNIAYRNALRYYKEILKSEGINIEIFDLYENVASFGLREMPQVYELWCLVTQIKVLEESFHFEHEPKDLSALLKAINPSKEKITQYSKINFFNSLAGRRVTLHYQKRIAENKRPDFILEISSNLRTINLVLDSKFKNYNYKKSIIYETVDMTNKYGSINNYVFILHPCKDGTYNSKTVKYTNHGGDKIHVEYGEDEQKEFPFHDYGYIELKPNFTDTLKKLIAMSFEYLLEPSRNAKQDNIIDPKPENDMFCISCGKDNVEIDKIPRGDNRFHYSCTCNETDCEHKIYIDYCWNCKTKLFKHGSYWDYHLESTWSNFDIHCPNCGLTVADRPMM